MSLTLVIRGKPVSIAPNETSGNAMNALPDSGAWLRGRMAHGVIVVVPGTRRDQERAVA